MATSTTVPVTVTPEAATRIAELGFGAQVERMIDYARRNLPDLTRIEVILYDRYDLGDEPGLAVEVYSSRPFDASDRTDSDLGRWYVTEFPADVQWHIIMCYH